MKSAVKKFLSFFKAVAYGCVIFFVYTNFLGPEEVGNLVGIQNIDQSNIEYNALVLSKGLIGWTIFAAALEIVDNLFDLS